MKAIQVFLVIGLFFSSLSINSQNYSRETFFEDDFDTNENKWNIVDGGYYANVTGGKYHLYLSPANSMNWAWTYVNLPKAIHNNWELNDDISLEFSFTVKELDTTYKTFSLSGLGLMFDLHGVTVKCPGGTFFEVYLMMDGNNSMRPIFRKNDNCKLGEATFLREGEAVPILADNHVVLKRNGYNWSLKINDIKVLDFSFAGKVSIDALKYGKGYYLVDDFKVYSEKIQLPAITEITSNEKVENDVPKIWALCVGIEDYSLWPKTKSLSYTVDDAEAYYDYLHSFNGGNVPSRQIKKLVNFEATAGNICNSALELFSKANENDLIVVFLSGHGANGNFCASDNYLKYSEINRILEHSKAKRKLLIADACHSGTWAYEKNVYKSKGEKLTDDEILKLFYKELGKSSKNVTYFLAARPEELSWENNTFKHGIFTHYLIEGLQCEAKRNDGDEFLRLGDLFKYVNSSVYKETSTGTYTDDDGNVYYQNPVIDGNYDDNMPVGICWN